jgi:hypothetical protein
MLLLNIYFNMALITPHLDNADLQTIINKSSSEIFSLQKQSGSTPEMKVDQLMQDYVKNLLHVKNIKDDAKAMEMMKIIRAKFMQRATDIAPEIKFWLGSIPAKQASLYKEQMLLKPYFKSINDITISYSLSHNMDQKPQLKKSFEAMNDFLNIIYN